MFKVQFLGTNWRFEGFKVGFLECSIISRFNSLIHVQIHPLGRIHNCMHTCVHGHMHGWLHVFSRGWMAMCIYACMDNCVHGCMCT